MSINTQNIIKRSGVFDDVDAKYGIPEEERKAAEESGQTSAGGEMGVSGGAPPPPEPATAGGAEPLSESRKSKILGMLGEEKLDFNDLFDMNKAQQNIYEIENKIKDILND